MRARRAGFALAALIVAAPGVGADELEPPGPSLGLALSGPSIPDSLAVADRRRPIEVRVTAEWSAIESASGVFDWSTIEPTVTALAERGAAVSLCVRGESPLHPRDVGPTSVPDGAWLQACTALLRSAVDTFGKSVATIEVGDRPERSFDPVAYAFVLKSASLAVKAEAKERGIEVRVSQGAVGSGALAWQKTLFENDTAPYIDVLPVVFEPGADVAAGVAAFSGEAVLHPPAATIRADVEAGEHAWSAFDGAVRALSAAAPTALVFVSPDPTVDVARVVAGLQSRLAWGFAPAPVGGLALRAPTGGAAAGAEVIGRFLHAKDFATLVVYEAPMAAGTDGQARLLLDTIDVKDPEVIDLMTGSVLKTGPAPVPGEKARALRVLLADHPMAVAWQRAAVGEAGLDIAAEDVQVASTRGLTAQEIIARHQQVQKIQDDRLERWTAKGHVDFHFKFAQGGSSIDVSIDSNYFWRRGADLEWEQTRYYVNGNLVRWKKIPELPLVQPEKVVTLPLDLTLDKTYDYRLVGEDTVQERAAYVLAFEPAAGKAGKSLYRGRVWIDKETFVRLKVSVVQTNLEPPVVSNDENDSFLPVDGPDGFAYRMLTRADGQQLWTVGGRNFVVRREVRFYDFEINPPEKSFDQALESAHASEHQMLRDTDQGFRYLTKDKTGARTLKTTQDTSQLFLVGGLFKDSSVSSVVPLAGVNWFDYKFLKKDIQFNVFFAGVYAFVNLTDPSIGGTKLDLGVEASLVGLKLDDNLFVAGTEDVSQRVRRRSQYLTGRLGYPLGTFVKMSVIGDIAWNQYTASSDANDALAVQNAADGTDLTYVLPANHQVYTGTLQLEFNKMGYSLTARGAYAHRSSWEPWGFYDTTTGEFVESAFDPDQASFTSWGVTAFKEWYLPHFQKLKLQLAYLDGANLDRFSEYSFGFFGGESLGGYSGTGVRFDQGYIGNIAWGFNVLNAVAFNLSLDSARVRDSFLAQPAANHTGIGLSFNVVGPWMTVWQASYGRAILSDVPELEGKQEFGLVILKLFK